LSIKKLEIQNINFLYLTRSLPYVTYVIVCIVDYLYMYTSWLSIIWSSIVVDYPYYQLLLIIYLYVLYVYKMNMCNILRKAVARKAWTIARVFPTW